MSSDNNNHYEGATSFYYNVPPSSYQGQVFIPQDQIQYYQQQPPPPPAGAPVVFYTVNTPTGQIPIPSMIPAGQQPVHYVNYGNNQGEITTSQDTTTGQYRGNRTNYSDIRNHGNRGRGGNYNRRWISDERQRHGWKNPDDQECNPQNRYDRNQPRNTYSGNNDRKTGQFRRGGATKSHYNQKSSNVAMATSVDGSNTAMATSAGGAENKDAVGNQFVVNDNENIEKLNDKKDAIQDGTSMKGRQNNKSDDRDEYRHKNTQYNNSNNYGGYNQRRREYHDQGRGKNDYYDQGRGKNDYYDQGRGKNDYHDQGRGRGGYHQGRGRGGRNQYGGRNNWDSSSRSGYDNRYDRSSSGHVTHNRSNNYRNTRMSDSDNTYNKQVVQSERELQTDTENSSDNKKTLDNSPDLQNDAVSSQRENKQEDKNKTKEGGKGGNSQTRNKTRSVGGYDDGRNKLSTYQQPYNTDKYEKKESKAEYTTEKSRGRKQKPFITRTLSGKVDESQRGVLIEQLTLGTYECMVCCEAVRGQNAVWNCTSCYHVFHLRCVKKWAKSPTAIVEGDVFGWRCPACQNVCNKFPSQYRCFCGKIRDPEMNRMETPHSCGEVCKKSRGENCVHACNILCHPGPCPTCNALVKRHCACGKISQMMKCGATEKLHCDKVCDKQLNCGKHNCQSVCHEGPCSPCEENVNQECYGEHEKRTVICGSKESFVESYSCNKICDRTLDCGNHTCSWICHPDDCDTCKLSPSVVTHCPCGDTLLTDLSPDPRLQCTEPIPTCQNICGKVLPCGPKDNHHTCQQKCHEGTCGECPGETSITCRCGAIEKHLPCSEAQKFTDENPFCCDKRCSKKKSCGKHKCGMFCCVTEEHICDQICGKKLSCGLHKCDEVCHRSNCPPCLLAGFDELLCHCGAEVMYPPIPCGARPPECHRPCLRQHPCQHKVLHNCHSEDQCPPCVVLTEKWCMGKHQLRKNIPCHLTDISCGMSCDKVLPCSQHKCQKVCHKGECLDEATSCKQPCLNKRKECDHICGVPCHEGTECPAVPCKAQVTIKCPCGNKVAKVQCMMGGNTSTEISEFQKITMQNFAGSTQGQSVDLSQFSGLKKGNKRQLECDADCSMLERNRRVALALEIRNPDLNAKFGNPAYTDFLKEFAKSNPQFVATVEKTLADLVQKAKESKHPSRSHAFQSMNMNHRKLVHELAEFYGCQTQSYDAEPNKNVVATATRDKCWLPNVTLTALVQRELHPKAPTPIPHVHKESSIRQTAEAAKLSTDVLEDSKNKSKTDTQTSKSSQAAASKSSKSNIDYFDFTET